MLVNIPAPWSITGSGKLDLDHVGTVSYLDMKHEICGKKLGMNSEVPSFDQPCFFFSRSGLDMSGFQPMHVKGVQFHYVPHVIFGPQVMAIIIGHNLPSGKLT